MRCGVIDQVYINNLINKESSFPLLAKYNYDLQTKRLTTIKSTFFQLNEFVRKLE